MIVASACQASSQNNHVLHASSSKRIKMDLDWTLSHSSSSAHAASDEHFSFDDDLLFGSSVAPFDDHGHNSIVHGGGMDSGSSSSASSPEPAASMEEDPLAGQIDLDLTSDVFAHFDLESCLKTEASSCSSAAEPFAFLNDLDLHSMTQPPPPQDGSSEDTIKSDCMWSSSLDFLDSIHRRNRDNSLTLSECADSLFRDLKDIDCVLGGPANPVLNINVKSNSDIKEEESDLEMSDEEIDVVSDCDASSSSSSTISTFSTGSMSPSPSSRHSNNAVNNSSSNRPTNNIVTQAGRSLLRNSRHQQQLQQARFCAQPSQQTIIDHMNGDHCYFALRQEPSHGCPQQTPSSPPGLLTPNESSDDEDCKNSSSQTMINSRRFPINNIKQEQPMAASDAQHVKFKFRMKFKSNSPQRSLLNANGNRHHIKRKSASRNAHCPSPSPTKKIKTEHEDMEGEEEMDPLSIKKQSPSGSMSSRRTSANAKYTSQDQKCREIRDLHNSMERQRRVDLRNNFDQLKDVVPELRDVEKASKLNILNKSAEYCKALCSTDVRLLRERERELNRRALLQKKLLQLTQSFHHQGRMTSSGRMSHAIGRAY